MNYSKRIVILVILIGLVVASTAFILINSAMDFEKSHSSSGVVTNIITSTDDAKEWDHTDMIVRKFAHVIEYALFGITASALCLFISLVYRKQFYSYFITYALFMAVLDEHIQSFSDRVSSTSDILLDFFGSLLGFAFVVTIYLVVRYFIKKKPLKTI